MAYTQPSPLRLIREAPPLVPPNRKVLVAVELFDPIAQSLVSSGVTIAARGLDGDPILSWSGRFVWLEQRDRWPTAIAVNPERLPFATQEVQPPRPPNFPVATAAERLVRIVLRPTPAYPFDGVTAIRGRLSERPEPGSPSMPGVRVQVAWFDLNSASWVPVPPGSTDDALTNPSGEFAAFLRLLPVSPAEPDIDKGFLKVRLQFTTTGAPVESRATPDDYPFVPPAQAAGGRAPEGRMLQRDLRLAWSDLLPI
jgi:hypothetical protein